MIGKVHIAFNIQNEWDEILGDIDAKRNKRNPVKVLAQGGDGPCDVNLLDARTGRDTCIKEQLLGKTTMFMLLRHFR